MPSSFEFPFSVSVPCFMLVENAIEDATTGQLAFTKATRLSTLVEQDGTRTLLLFQTKDQADAYRAKHGFGEHCQVFQDMKQLHRFLSAITFQQVGIDYNLDSGAVNCIDRELLIQDIAAKLK